MRGSPQTVLKIIAVAATLELDESIQAYDHELFTETLDRSQKPKEPLTLISWEVLSSAWAPDRISLMLNEQAFESLSRASK